MGNYLYSDEKDHEVEMLKIYQKLMHMGFNEKNALSSATNHSSNLQEAIDHAIKHENDYNQQIESKTDHKTQHIANISSTEEETVEYQGTIFSQTGKKYWGLLHGSILIFYQSNKMDGIPYDLLDLSRFGGIAKFSGVSHANLSFGVILLDKHLTYLDKNVLSQQLSFIFQDEKNSNKWFESLQKTIHKKKK
eukprot:250664_1